MFATKEEFTASGKLHSIIMVQGNPAPTFNFVGSAHRLWGPEARRVEVWALPEDKDPPAIKTMRFAGTANAFEEDVPDPDRIGLRSLREMKQPGSRLSIWGDGESIAMSGAAEVTVAKAEVGRLATENTDLKAEIARLGEELENAMSELAELRANAARNATAIQTTTGAAPGPVTKAETTTAAETPGAKAAADDKTKGKPKA